MPFAELPFGIVIDLSFWGTILNLPSYERVLAIFAIIGWTVLALIFFFMGAELWVSVRQGIYTSQWKWITLAVDVPSDTVQSPKAVEQIFAQFSGAFSGPNLGEKYWQGVKQRWFSFEIISIEGYIQFLIFTESKFRDLVEAAIYAQYPMAEITEVEDYVSTIPDKYPNATHNMFGVEFGLAAEDPYPIRTYEEFEHSISKDVTFADPMAAILENLTRIGPGENLWLQIIIEPVSGQWKAKGIDMVKNSLQDKGRKLVKKIVENKKPAGKEFFLSKVVTVVAEELLNAIRPPVEAPVKKKEEMPAVGKLSDLTPGTKDTVAAIEEKISKIGFKTKLRAVYAATNEAFNPSRCLEGLIGSLSQFTFPERNGIVPKNFTSTHYAFKNYRLTEKKKSFVAAYKKRKIKTGVNPYILNIEELATVWHFPLPLVKTPLLQKTGGKRAEPPINLPIEEMVQSPLKKKIVAPSPEEQPPEVPPEAMYG